jgi:hypothetical protein
MGKRSQTFLGNSGRDKQAFAHGNAREFPKSGPITAFGRFFCPEQILIRNFIGKSGGPINFPVLNA